MQQLQQGTTADAAIRQKLAAEGARPNHIGIALKRHERAGSGLHANAAV